MNFVLLVMSTIPATSSPNWENRRRNQRLLFHEQRDVGRRSASSGHNAQLPSINNALEYLPLSQIPFLNLYNMASIEEEIDQRLPYRIGCPKLPVLPVETRPRPQGIDRYFPNFDYCQSYIRDILAKYNIPSNGILFVYRVNYGIEATNRHLTLVLLSSYQDSCQRQWVDAIKEIRTRLVQSGIHWAIELIDTRLFQRSFRALPILSTNRDLIEGWSNVLPNVLTTIENQNWVVIDVLHRESLLSLDTEWQATVFISAQDANDDTWWDITLPALHQLLQANKLELDIVLLFLQDVKLTMTGSADPEVYATPSFANMEGYTVPDTTISNEFYLETIHIGTSCATSGSTRSGTLGGKIKLQTKSSVFELGLTNYHVLSDAFANQESLGGPFPPVLGQLYGTAVSPSDRDHELAVQELQYSVYEAEKRQRDLSTKLEYLAEDDPSWEMKDRYTKAAFLEQKTLEARMIIAENYSRHIGQIYAASGFRTCKNLRYKPDERNDWALDWCLVRIDQQTSISPQLRNMPSKAHYARNGGEATQYCKISADRHYKVMKRGRTSGWTRGTLSAINSIIRIQDHYPPSPKLPTNQKVEFKDKWNGRPVWVHTIIGPETGLQFLQSGDSGSLVLLDQAVKAPVVSIAGLGFAANDASHASYMIPMDLVVEDIEGVTGAKVIEPRYAGQV